MEGASIHGRGEFIDGRRLGYLEKLTDTPYTYTDIWNNQYTDPIFPDRAKDLVTGWSEVFTELKGRILAQSVFADVLGTPSYDFSTDTLHFTDTLSTILARAVAAKPTSSTEAVWYWRELGQILVDQASEFALTAAQVKTQLDAVAGQVVQLFDAYLYGTNTGEEFVGGSLNDYFLGMGGIDDIFVYDGNDYVDAGADHDSINGGTGDDTLLGGSGDDFLKGEDGADSLVGGDGNDNLTGDRFIAFNDTLVGGAGNDYLSDNYGNNRLDGGSGADGLRGGVGNDTLLGGSENDTLSGDDGNDSLDGGTQNDRILGGAGNDRLIGNSGNDYLQGDAGNDTITAAAGLDTLDGGDGSDSLDGGDDTDRLTGGLGADILKGGNGADIFILKVATHSTAAASDRISDFTHGSDRIDVGWQIVSNFSQLTISLYTTSSGEARTFVTANNSADFKFYLVGNHLTTLDASDFMF